MYPKWEAYLRLAVHVPAEYLSLHVLCQDAAEVRQAWPRVAAPDTHRAGVRTDTAGGALGLPFIHKATLEEALALVATHGTRLVFLLAQYVEGTSHGKILRLDTDAVFVEWGACSTAREFDAGRCTVQYAVLGSKPYAIWGEQVWRCQAVTYQPRHLQTLYRVFRASGLPASTWSLTHDDRIVLWG